MKEIKVKFNGVTCTVEKHIYGNDRTALVLMNGGQVYAKATVNLPDEQIDDDKVFIKDYSENEGMMNALVKAKIVKPTGRMVELEYVTVPEAKLLI